MTVHRSRVATLAGSASVVLALAASAQTPASTADAADSIRGPLVISTAGSMAATMRNLAADFVARHPGVTPDIRPGGSVAAARAVANPARVPDVFVSADDTIIDVFLMPRFAAWSAGFARSVLVLAYTANSKYADEISTRNWVDVLSRPEVHGARGDPNLDPGAYRAVMLFELAARFYLRPQLTATLEHAMPITDFGPGGRDLEAKFKSGAIDYMPIYRTSAAERGLNWIELPSPINLGDTAFAASYAAVAVRLPSGVPELPDTVAVRGSPILYGLTVPRAAPHAGVALAFARFALSSGERGVIRNGGFDALDHAILHGDAPAGLIDSRSR